MARFALDDDIRAALSEAIKPIRAQWEAELAVVLAERDGAREQKEEAIRRWQAAEAALAQARAVLVACEWASGS